MRLRPVLLLGLLVSGPAWAGDLVVTVKTPSGQPVTDAAVVVVGLVDRKARHFSGAA